MIWTLVLVNIGILTFVGGRTLSSDSLAFLTLGSRTLTSLAVGAAGTLTLSAAGSLTLMSSGILTLPTPGALTSLMVMAAGP